MSRLRPDEHRARFTGGKAGRIFGATQRPGAACAGPTQRPARGRGTGTVAALCAVRPDHAHRGAVLAGVGHHVGGPAVGASGLAVPHRVSSSASSTMRLLAAMWDSGVEAVNGRRRTTARASRASYPGCESSSSPARYPAAGTTTSRVPPRSVTARAKIWSAPSARQDRPVTPGARPARAADGLVTRRAVGLGSPDALRSRCGAYALSNSRAGPPRSARGLPDRVAGLAATGRLALCRITRARRCKLAVLRPVLRVSWLVSF